MTGFIFCHGWGLGPDFFSPLWKELQRHYPQSPALFWNLGYCGETHTPLPFKGIERWVGIGHSLGFAKLLESRLPFKGIIGLQAFVNFLGTDPALHKRQTLSLRAFSRNFRANPLTALASFRHTVGEMERCNSVNLRQLEEDINFLKHDYSCLLPSLPTLVIGNEHDPVVLPSLLKDNFHPYPDVNVIINREAGHGVNVPVASKQITRFVRSL